MRPAGAFCAFSGRFGGGFHTKQTATREKAAVRCGPEGLSYSSTRGFVGSMRRKSSAAITSMAAITKSGAL